MKNLLDISGIKVLNRKQQSSVNGGGCDSICSGQASAALLDAFSKWICGCSSTQQ